MEKEAPSEGLLALAIVGALLVIAVGLILVLLLLRGDAPGAITFGLGTIIGALATALNPPNGVASALRQALTPKPADPNP